MPIKPENRSRYPHNWLQIRTRLMERARYACEGSPRYPDCRAANGMPHPVTGSKVVLTCAHLNHTPEDVRDENLRVMCQRCHLTYDAEYHARSRREGAMKKIGLIAIVVLCLATGALAEDRTQIKKSPYVSDQYDIVKDGKRIGTIRKNPYISDQWDVRDTEGHRERTIKKNPYIDDQYDVEGDD